MKGSIEFQKIYDRECLASIKRIDKNIKKFKSEFSFLTEKRLKEIIDKKLAKRARRVVSIPDMNHKTQNYYRTNNYLSELFAFADLACENYSISPIGNFFTLDYPRIIGEHRELSETHPGWYAYRNDAFDWSIEETIKHYAWYKSLRSYSTQVEKEEKFDRGKIVFNKAGFLNTKEIAKYIGKPQSTVSRWAREKLIPAKMINGRYMFNKEEVEIFIEKLN